VDDADDEVIRGRIGQVAGGRWTLERLLGTGGMAAVYAARHVDGRVAAVKVLHPEMSLRKDVRERFLREGAAANTIGHPGVVQVLEDGTADGSTYLVMELLEGETLSDRVRRLGASFPPEEMLGLLDAVLDVLAAAHGKGIIHRDLKPDNLFVMTDGRIKVLDFGLARLLDDVPGSFKTKTGLALGTLPYMAPEQALGRRAEIDGRADLFALGATAFRILAGRKIHEAESEAELLMAMASKPAPPLKSVAPQVPDGLCSIVDLALAFSRDARYPDAPTMQSDVRAVQSGQAPPHAASRIGAREEATRADLPAPVVVPAQVAGDLGGSMAPSVSGVALSSPGSIVPSPASKKPPPLVVALLAGGALVMVLALALGAVYLLGGSKPQALPAPEPGGDTPAEAPGERGASATTEADRKRREASAEQTRREAEQQREAQKRAQERTQERQPGAKSDKARGPKWKHK
jgi:eukaryotic-like serine/threonine-protein kinase